ncbi:MAG: TIR domain-containing protein, partial [Cenarchaeum sp. SB0669_bin_11]|nr:TIR domain-containing protein [Cenarchaeum sp. SB0669_bin_11]
MRKMVGMIAKSFISHTENGGTGPGKTIQDQLIHTELEMETFLSQNSIKGGDHIPQKILEFLLETDVLFVIFEPLVRKSRWVRWEYEFCKNRHIRIIPVVVGEFSNVIGKEIDWIESNDKYLLYDFRDEKLRYDAWRAITNIKDELEQRATERVRTVLEADVNNAFCFEQDTVKISGKVENALTGRACMYIPSLRDDYPPIITNVI